MEGAHGQLRARLADRLGGDNTNRFADINQHTTTQIATITLRAKTEARVACQRRTDFDFVNTGRINCVNHVFVEQRARLDDHRPAIRLHGISDRDTAENALAQCFDNFAAFDQRFYSQAVGGAAIIFGHHQILRHVNQTTREVARVGGLQRGIGKTFTRTVGRNEVLQDIQTFAEVRRDRGLDDRAIGLRHQTAHTRQLANLCSRAACAGISHHVNGVERLLRGHLAVARGDGLGT